jgi:hypothetical protein
MKGQIRHMLNADGSLKRHARWVVQCIARAACVLQSN